MRCEYAVLVLVLVLMLMLMLLLPDQTLGLCFGADPTLDAKVCTYGYTTWTRHGCMYCTVHSEVNSYGIAGRGSDLFHTFTHHDFYVHFFLLSNVTKIDV